MGARRCALLCLAATGALGSPPIDPNDRRRRQPPRPWMIPGKRGGRARAPSELCPGGVPGEQARAALNAQTACEMCGSSYGPWAAATRAKSACSFANGVRIYAADAEPAQLRRYAAAPHLHEPHEERLFVLLLHEAPAGSVFVDVGAALGYYCALAARLRPYVEVHALNPSPSFVAKLAATVALNGGAAMPFADWDAAGRPPVQPGRVVQHPYGVGAAEGQFVFSDGFAGRIGGAHGARLNGTVPVKTFDALVRDCLRAPAQDVWLMMMDIQTFEGEVLESAGFRKAADKIAHLIVGVHDHLKPGPDGSWTKADMLRRIRRAVERGSRLRLHFAELNDPTQPDGVALFTRFPADHGSLRGIPVKVFE
jgi:FkbM family methyltransferase